MGTIPSDDACKRMSDLARAYVQNNGNYLEHGPYGWDRRWGALIPPDWGFPNPLTRKYIFDLVQAVRSDLSAEGAEKVFLAIMVWGFGNTGYGPDRVEKMRDSRPEGLGHYMLDVIKATKDGPAAAYGFMATKRAVKLGPSYASKVAYFVTQDEGSPILDSLVARWIYNHHGRKWVFNPNKWSTPQYLDFRLYCQKLLDKVGTSVPEGQRTLGLVEYLMFVDQVASSLPKWARTI